MKKFLTNTVTAISASIIGISSALAGLPDNTTGISGLATGSGYEGITSAIAKIVNYVLNILLILGVAFIVIAGIRLIVSGGDEGEKDKAKTIILYVAAGIIIVLLAKVIVLFVNSFL